MAFNKIVFKTRALSAFIFVLVMAAGLLWNGYSFFILISIIHIGAWWEYFKLIDKIQNKNSHLFTRIGFILMGQALLLWTGSGIFQLHDLHPGENGSLFFSAAGFMLVIAGIIKTKEPQVSSFFYAAFGFLYLSLSCALLISLAGMDQYPDIVVGKWLPTGLLLPGFIIGCMWINDTMAYVTGSLIGKTPLSKISPKKTWEGTTGGILFCGFIAGWVMYKTVDTAYFDPGLLTWFLLAVAAAVLGTLGDLFESKLKRMAAVKDSGNLLPGHGGFLDRFDSLVFATPYLWLLFHFFL
jgi:phosphatidate cytidylyltransferase